MVADELLTVLRGAVRDDASYVDEPVRLGGGFYTDNYAFRIAGGGSDWTRPMVLRLFPRNAPAGLAQREAMVQDMAVAGGVPAPRVVLQGDGIGLIASREWFVMERMSGHPALGGIEVGVMLRSAPFVVRRLPRATAETQARLHRVDATPLVDAMGDDAGIGRWLTILGERAAGDAPGLAGASEWLSANRPAPPARPVLCHGDLWGGNLLIERGAVSGVIDWTLATAAEPAFDVGFTTMSLYLAPIPVGPRLRATLRVASRWLGRRYLAAYTRLSAADLSNVPYYEALRCAIELSGVIGYRNAAATGAVYDSARPSWDVCADDMVDYFRERTGVTIGVPLPVDG